MWRGVRCTVRRASLSSRICARVFTARRWRLCFLLMFMVYAELFFLAFFEDDLLIRVAHALALVRLGRTDAADFGRGLTNSLPVIAFDQYLGLARGLDRDALGNRVAHRMREAQREIQCLAGHLRAKADAHEFELAVVTLGHALHHVRQMRIRISSSARSARLNPRWDRKASSAASRSALAVPLRAGGDQATSIHPSTRQHRI